jgi:hypothetical protein
MKFVTYIMAYEPIPTAYFINPSHQCVSVCVSMCIVATQRLGRQVPVAMNKNINKRIFGGIVLHTVRFVSKKSLWVSL